MQSRTENPDSVVYKYNDMDDPRFRIRPYQQIAASLTGASITSLFSK